MTELKRPNGSGGTEGGLIEFGVGSVLAVLSMVFFFNSVIATSGDFGAVSGLMHRMGGRFGSTTSMGIIFVPFVLAVIALFYDASKQWAWMLLSFGLLLIVVEVLSRLRFEFSMRLGSLLLMMALFAAGLGLILRSYRNLGSLPPDDKKLNDK